MLEQRENTFVGTLHSLELSSQALKIQFLHKVNLSDAE